MKDAKSVKQNTGADLRAMAEAKLAAQAAAVEPKTPRQQLDEHKATVRRGLRGFVEVGTSLGLISKLKLFREDGYATFDDFVTSEFEVSRAWAYRAIDAARVVTLLSQVETIASTIVNQSQALELAPLVKSTAAMVTVVEATAARGPVTAERLKAVRVELFPNPKVIDGEIVPDRAEIEAPKSPIVEAMTQAIEEVQTAAVTPPGVPADGGNTPEEPNLPKPPASGPSSGGVGDGSDVTPDEVGAESADAGRSRASRKKENLLATQRGDAARRLRYFESGALSAAGPAHHFMDVPCAAADDEDAVLRWAADLFDTTCLDCLRAVVASTDSPVEDLSGSQAAVPSTGAPAGQPQDPDGSEAEGLVATTDRPGIDHPDPHLGEAPVAPPAPDAGVTPRFDGGEDVGREAVEGEAGPSSSTDPAMAVMGPAYALLSALDELDYDVVSPMLLDREWSALDSLAVALPAAVELLHRWKEKGA